MDTINVLEQFGISEKGAIVYLAVLELGQCTASEIGKKTKIQRTLIYDICKRLISQGILNPVQKDNIMYFTAVSPDSLLRLEEQKVDRLRKKLPEINAKCRATNISPKISYYEGKDGIDIINNDTLKHKGEIIGFTTPKYVSFRQRHIQKEYAENRMKAGNRARIIGEQCQEVVDLKRRDKESSRETKIIPRNIFSSDVELIIYGNKISLVDYKDEFGLIIDGQSISSTLKKIFEIVWQNADKL